MERLSTGKTPQATICHCPAAVGEGKCSPFFRFVLFIKYSVLQNNLNGLNDENFMSEFLKKYEFDNIIFKSFISPNSFYDYLYDKSKLFLNYDEVVKVELFDSKFLNYYIYQQE